MTPKLADFGSARCATPPDHQPAHPSTHTLTPGPPVSALGNDPKVIATGTPAYMAPEVALGSLAQATGSAAGGAALLASRCAVDVYGLGCVVLDLSRPGGRRRRDGGGGGAWRLTPDDPLLARLQSNFAPQIHPSTPPPLAELLRAALAVDPAGRPSAEQARVWLTGMAASSVAWAVAEGQAQAPEGGLGAAVVDG